MEKYPNVFLTSIQVEEKKEFESSFLSENRIKNQTTFIPKWRFILSENNKKIIKNIRKKDWFLFDFDGKYSFAAQVLKKSISNKSNTKSSLVYFENIININKGFVKTNRELEIKLNIPSMHKISLLAVNDLIIQKIIKQYNSFEKFLHDKKSILTQKKSIGKQERIKNHEIVIQAASIKNPPETIKTYTNRVVRDTIKTKKLKIIYNYLCQICGFRIFDNYADVHHVWPISEKPIGGDDDYDNMLVLCPNHHAMFDLGLIKFEISKKNSLVDINGKKIGNIHFNRDHYLHQKNIAHNNMRVEKTYGT